MICSSCGRAYLSDPADRPVESLDGLCSNCNTFRKFRPFARAFGNAVLLFWASFQVLFVLFVLRSLLFMGATLGAIATIYGAVFLFAERSPWVTYTNNAELERSTRLQRILGAILGCLCSIAVFFVAWQLSPLTN